MRVCSTWNLLLQAIVLLEWWTQALLGNAPRIAM